MVEELRDVCLVVCVVVVVGVYDVDVLFFEFDED